MTEPLVRFPEDKPPTANDRAAEGLTVTDLPASHGTVSAVPETESPPGTPRWVKLFGIGAIVLFLLVAGLHLSGHAPTHGMPMHTVLLP
jgi:hypothetical protein